jgi:predicted acylesterase/phospholipase RssA
MSVLGVEKKCDLVMQGGITSGIVYPATVCRLAQEFKFENIGGTSAGAMAAAATAAAEFARRRNDASGFEKLSRLPEFLAQSPSGKKGSNLFWLFQPDLPFRPLFYLATSFLSKPRLPGIITNAVRFAWWELLLSLAVATLLTLPIALHAQPWMALLQVLVCLALVAMFFALLFAWKVLRQMTKIPANGFGVCSGMSAAGAAQPEALTQWLSRYINEIAGKTDEEPLTFGDLRNSGIRLRMITTCITHGRPYGLPFGTESFFFKEDEFRQYFPDAVVRWMKEHAKAAPSKRPGDPTDLSGFVPLPDAAELPVIVAARMSLSFPFLFRAIPLYAIDYSLRRTETQEAPHHGVLGGALPRNHPRRPERCWFIDGGVCSNFPLHLFDAPLPRWPTFGINLQPLRKDRPDSFVWMPSRNEDGASERWWRFNEGPGVASILKFAALIIDAARNWMDNRQIGVPGYRDRIVQIRLDEAKEGGLNLSMPAEVVKLVADRGTSAADLLIEHFATPTEGMELTWDNHRWLRFRSMFSLIEQLLLEINTAFTSHESYELSYSDLLTRDDKAPPRGYRLGPGQKKFFESWVPRFLALVEELNMQPERNRASAGAPRPQPIFRVTPHMMTKDDPELPSQG